MDSPQDLDWLDDQGEQSSPPWCHFSCSAQETREDMQHFYCFHQCLQQTPVTFQSSITEHPSSLFVSRDCSIQRTVNSIRALEEENFIENQEDSVTEVNPSTVTLNPARVSPRLHSSDVYLSGTGRQFPGFETGSGIQLSSDYSSTPYTVECFERHYPYELASPLLHSHSATSTFEEERFTDMSDYSRRLDSELAAPESLPKLLTETKQADLESVFNSTTGQQHKVPLKKERRKSTLSESLHRRLIRGLGGQCKSCKRRKRRCDRSHLVSDSPYSSQQSEASNSSSPELVLATLNLGPEGHFT